MSAKHTRGSQSCLVELCLPPDLTVHVSCRFLRLRRCGGSALDGLLPLHLAQRGLRLGIVGSAGAGLQIKDDVAGPLQILQHSYDHADSSHS